MHDISEASSNISHYFRIFQKFFFLSCVAVAMKTVTWQHLYLIFGAQGSHGNLFIPNGRWESRGQWWRWDGAQISWTAEYCFRPLMLSDISSPWIDWFSKDYVKKKIMLLNLLRKLTFENISIVGRPFLDMAVIIDWKGFHLSLHSYAGMWEHFMGESNAAVKRWKV